MKLLKYILPALAVGLLLAGGVHALSVSLPSSIHKGDLLVGSSTGSSLYTVSTGTQGSVLWVNSSGLPSWTATTTLGITSGGAGTWGSITGTLSSQTDLQNALNAKLSTTSAASTYVPQTTNIGTTAPLQGGGNLTGNLTLSMTQASSTANGWLSSTDWNTFNGKQNSGAYLTTVTADAPLSGSGTAGSH